MKKQVTGFQWFCLGIVVACFIAVVLIKIFKG
jgi:hypothetical protein